RNVVTSWMTMRIVTSTSACPNAERGPVSTPARAARSPPGKVGTSASAAAMAPASTKATSFRKPDGARPPRSTIHMTNERLIASAESLPFADGAFDVAMAGFVIRNVGDIPQGLREMRRVLRAGGRAVILDLHTPRNPTVRRLYRTYSFVSPRLAAALGSD